MKMMVISVKRSICLITVIMIFVCLLQLLSGWVVSLVSRNDDLSNLSRSYCITGMMGIYFSGVSAILTTFFVSRKEYYVPLISMGISSLSSLLLNWVLVSPSKNNIVSTRTQFSLISPMSGAGFAWSCTELLRMCILIYFGYLRGKLERFSLRIDKLALSGWRQLILHSLRNYSYNIYIDLSGWVIFTLCAFQAGCFTSNQLGTFVILSVLFRFLSRFSEGMSLSHLSFLRDEVNKRDLPQCLRISKIMLIIILLYLFLILTPLFYTRTSVISLFSSGNLMADILVDNYHLFLAVIIMHSLSVAMTTIATAIRSDFSLLLLFLLTIILTQSLVYYFAHSLQAATIGIWLAVFSSSTLAALLNTLNLGLFTDWSQSIQRFHHNNFLLQAKHKNNNNNYILKLKESLVQQE